MYPLVLVQIRNQTWRRLRRIRLSVHSLASSLANLDTSSLASAMDLEMVISSRLLPSSSWTDLYKFSDKTNDKLSNKQFPSLFTIYFKIEEKKAFNGFENGTFRFPSLLFSFHH